VRRSRAGAGGSEFVSCQANRESRVTAVSNTIVFIVVFISKRNYIIL
jgi:hypothetical protein